MVEVVAAVPLRVYLDSDVAERLRALIPDGQRSFFVQRCVEAGLAQLEREQGQPGDAAASRLLRAAATIEKVAELVRGAAAAARPEGEPDAR